MLPKVEHPDSCCGSLIVANGRARLSRYRQAATEVTAVRDEPDKAAATDGRRPVVMLDGAYIRAVPGHQVRNFEAICGKVEREGQPTRRFALVRSISVVHGSRLRAH